MASDQQSLVNPQELWFLLLQHIYDSPLSKLIPALEVELHAHRLLPERHTIVGANFRLPLTAIFRKIIWLPQRIVL